MKAGMNSITWQKSTLPWALVLAIGLLVSLGCPEARAQESEPAAEESAEANPTATDPALDDSDSAAEAATDAGELEAAIDSFLSSLEFRSGEIDLASGLATLRLEERFQFLGAEDTERVLVEAWGNPPGSEAIGMILPAGLSPIDDASWAVVVQYNEDGYVSDEDASEIDFDELLEEMQQDVRDANSARLEAGYPSLELVGWAEPPAYRAETNKLYWAKELAFDGSDDHTLNYNIRILGRRGVLVLNAVGNMSQLADIRNGMSDVLGRVDFQSGNRYADFDPSMDEVAAYGVGALVAGKLAAKAGLLAKLGGLLLAGKKFLWLGIVAVAAGLRSLFGRKKPAAES